MSRGSTVLLLSSLALIATDARSETPTELPRNVRPTHYDIAIVPDAGALTFTGKATISMEVLEPTSTVTLNALELTFAEARLLPKPGGAPLAPRIAVRADRQTATFSVEKPLAPGLYDLAVTYAGKIGTQAAGLYVLDYDTPGGRRRALFTQFENSDARRLFPSWDEPAYKATFDLRVEVPPGQMAVSNMPIARTDDLEGGRSRVQFARTPKMSTYLLYLAMGDFERTTKIVGPTEIGVVTKRGSVDQAAFALDSSVEVLAEYNDYFGVPYPLPKLDNIAAPGRSQFFGAMENWGAISSFEYYLLLDPVISTESDRQSIFSVAAHEISHQWFGDLVTMSWWDDLWLNESFASWMASRTVAKLRPEWNTWLATVKARDKAMERDALTTTHAIVQRIATVEQASQAFDPITYEKGEAVIRMLEGYVGADAWREGVRRYIRKHAYGNTVSEDLWREIEAAAAQPIRDIAHDFTEQPGIPLIRIDGVACVDGQSDVLVSQAEFSKDRPAKTPLRWQVPVIASTIGGAPTRTIVTDGKARMKLAGCGPVVLNMGQSGYYRTLYGPTQFRVLAAKFDSIAPIDQLGLLSDARALGRAGLQPASDVLELAKGAPSDADPQVWGMIADIYNEIDDDARDDPARRATFRAFAAEQLRSVFERVGWTPRAGEPGPVAILRNTLIHTLGDLADPAVVSEARRRYAAQATDPTAVPGALRKAVLAVVARNADAATWDKLHAAALQEKTPLIKDQLYFMLASSVDPTLARRALELALTDEPGATISAEMIATVAVEHPDLAFDFAISHRELVNRKVDPISASRYYARLAFRSADRAMLAKLKSYATANLAETSRGDTELAAAAVDDRIRERDRVLPDVSRWLTSNGFSFSAF